jgi:hypothetical protein
MTVWLDRKSGYPGVLLGCLEGLAIVTVSDTLRVVRELQEKVVYEVTCLALDRYNCCKA